MTIERKNQRNIDLLIFHYIKEPVRYNSLKSENARPIYGVKKGKMHRYGAVLAKTYREAIICELQHKCLHTQPQKAEFHFSRQHC